MALGRIAGFAIAFAAAGCGRDVQLGYNRPRIAVDASLGSDAEVSDTGTLCIVRSCSGRIYACGDCLDNDGDGFTDSFDPECLGPCDNTEDSYFGGIPGQNNAPCKQDCYFDQDTGSGNDDCNWSQKCDALSVSPAYPPSGDVQCAYDLAAPIPGTNSTCLEVQAQQSATCTQVCLPLTPNGCDCFGCCELPARSGHFVWIGSTIGGVGSCDAAHLDDANLCKPCTRVASCFNDCAECEICAGQSALDAPCATGAELQCPAGVQECGRPGQPSCPELQYCISGCCAATPG